MIKWIGTFAAGLALGGCAVLLIMRQGTADDRGAAHPTAGLPAPSASQPAVPGSRAVSVAEIREMPSRFDRIAAMYDLLRSADVRTVEELLEEADGLSNDGGSLRSVIYSRYVQLSPRAAATRLLAEQRDRPVELMHALAVWAGDDLDAALAFLETLEPSLGNQAAMYIISRGEDLSESGKERIAIRFSMEPYLEQVRASVEARMDPEGAWQNALSMEAGERRTQALWGIAYTWFGDDPRAALSALDSITDADTRDSWRQALIRRWIATDRDAALDWTLAQPHSGKRTEMLRQVAAAVAVDSPTEMLEVADTLDPEERRQVAQRVLDVWAQTDPLAALSALEEMADPGLTQAVQHSMVTSWARSDPRAAFDWALAQPPSAGRSSSLTTTLGTYASSDPETALFLADRLDAELRSKAVEAVVRQWANEDPLAAAAWLDSSPEENTAAVSAVVRGYTNLDPDAAFDWLLKRSIGAQRQSISTVVHAVAARSPESARHLIDRIEDSEVKQFAGGVLVSRWVETDPRAAVRAIARMDDELSQQLYANAFSSWAGFDREGAMAFLNQIPSSDRDWAIQGILRQALFSENTDLAERMYNRLASEEARRHAAMTMYFQLRRTDPAKAERYRPTELQIDERGNIRVP